MTVLLLRLDERLIHGQVVVGWGGELHPDRYVVIDDRIVVSDIEKDIYTLSAPVESEVEFLSVADAAGHVEAWKRDASRTVVLIRDVDTLSRLAGTGALTGMTVNLGGLHPSGNREEVLPYLHLETEERDLLLERMNEGLTLSARELPSGPEVTGADLERRLRART